MERDEEMDKRETSLLGSIKNTISRSSETAILEFERICESLGWRRSTIVNSQKIKRRRNKTDIYKRVLSDNTRRSAVRDIEIQTDGVYTPPKHYNHSNNHINSNNNSNNINNTNSNERVLNRSQRSRQNKLPLTKGLLEVLERTQTQSPPPVQRERSLYSVSPPSQSTNAISRTMSTQTQTAVTAATSPEPPLKKASSSGLISPERSSNSISSSIDADPISIGRKHNITPSPERISTAATVSPQRPSTRPTIQSESPGSVKQLRSQIEEQLKSPYRSPTTPTRFNMDRSNGLFSPERRPLLTDNLNKKSPSPLPSPLQQQQQQQQQRSYIYNNYIDKKQSEKREEQDNQQQQQRNNSLSPIRTSPIRSPYSNQSPSSPRRRNMLSPSDRSTSGSPRKNIYIPDSPGSVRRLASQIESELKSPYLRPGMVIPKLTPSPIRKAESPTRPSNILHKVAMNHHKMAHNDMDFDEEGERIARLEKEIKNVGTEVSMLGSYNILESPHPSHVSNTVPSIPITPTTPTLTSTNNHISNSQPSSFIPEAPPFIKRSPRELIEEAMNKREESKKEASREGQIVKSLKEHFREPLHVSTIMNEEKQKPLKPTELHKSKMREIIYQIPHAPLRRTDMIRGPNGEMIINRFWNEIYNPKIRNI